jgi:aryl-alcohol dehydrogenase-like predicted oxidoreductase
MAFGEETGWGASKSECDRMLGAYAEAGGNFIDTADKYTGGTSERYVGELIAPRRDRWVLATKYTLSRDEDDPNGAGNHRKSLVCALDASLRRLGTDYVDLLWVHMWDYLTPVDELMRALDDQVRAGKVLYVGISNTPAWIISQANTLADFRGWTPFTAIQVEYSLLTRDPERELIPMAAALELAVTAWSPLGSGVLTGKYLGEQNGGDDRRLDVAPGMSGRFLNERNLEIAAAVAAVAGELGATPAQVALAWLRSRAGIVIPILGARTERQIRENLGSLAVELEAGQLARLDALSAISLGSPYDFLQWAAASPYTFGKAYAQLDSHRDGRAGRAFERHLGE